MEGALTVIVPAHWVGVADWQVQVGERTGPVNAPLPLEPGPHAVVVTAQFAHREVQAAGEMRFEAEIYAASTRTVHVPADPLARAIAVADFLARRVERKRSQEVA